MTTHADTTIAADAQRIFISVHDGVDRHVTQIGVPATNADYGVVIPVAAEPTLDPTPVMAAELDVLFSADSAPSRPSQQSGGSGGGCGCPLATGGANNGGGGPPGVRRSANRSRSDR